jgi:hypothetical protein
VRTSCGTRRRSWEAFQKCFQQWKERWAKCGVPRGLICRGLGIAPPPPPQVRIFFSPGLRSDTFWTGWYCASPWFQPVNNPTLWMKCSILQGVLIITWLHEIMTQ